MHPEADILTQPSALRSLKSPKKVGLFFGGGGSWKASIYVHKSFSFFERRRKSLKCSTFESPPKPHFFSSKFRQRNAKRSVSQVAQNSREKSNKKSKSPVKTPSQKGLLSSLGATSIATLLDSGLHLTFGSLRFCRREREGVGFLQRPSYNTFRQNVFFSPSWCHS